MASDLEAAFMARKARDRKTSSRKPLDRKTGSRKPRDRKTSSEELDVLRMGIRASMNRLDQIEQRLDETDRVTKGAISRLPSNA